MSTESAQPPAYLDRAVTDLATAWDARMAQVVRHKGAVIALRGAGSVNGIDPAAADIAVDELLIPAILEARSERPVAVVYDGDPDNPDKPDIGYVFGRLQDRFAGDEDTSFLVAQTSDWYYPPSPGSNLKNARGLSAETFVFNRGEYPGDHNRFTQSPDLARHPGYRQFYVGPAGMLATGQMIDYLDKAGSNPANITVVRTLINESLSAEIAAKLAAAKTDADRAKIASQLEQRQAIFGSQWKPDGSFNCDLLKDVTVADDHELVVLWTKPDCVDVVNCRKIDLNSPEYDRKFEEAKYFVKTKPIQARQVPVGRTEEVIVNSGATRDTAKAGDWICTSVSGEPYVVHAEDFPTIYDADPDNSGWFKPRHDPRKLVKVTEDVLFTAPWGEPQAVQSGGYLIQREIQSGPRAGQVERYGIAKKDVESDFVPV